MLINSGKIKDTDTLKKKPGKQNFSHNALTSSIPMPQNGSKVVSSFSPAVIMTPASSFCSPRQFLNSNQSPVPSFSSSDQKTKKSFIGNHDLFSGGPTVSSTSMSLSSQSSYAIMSHVPPPSLINPPPPVSLMPVNISSTKTPKTLSLKPRNNLEQRLVQIFGKAAFISGLFFLI